MAALEGRREREWEWGGVVYCATISAGPRSCSGIGYGALDMIRVPSLIPAPLSRPVWGLSSRSAGRWPGKRRRRENGVGVEGSQCCADSGFVATATRCFFHVENAEHGRRLHACWFYVSHPKATLNPPSLLQPPPPLVYVCIFIP